MKIFLPLLFGISTLLLFSACKPRLVSSNGIDFISIRSSNPTNLMYKHQQGENTVLLKVDNVSLYEDIYGKIFSESSVLPTAVAINRIYWFNSTVSAASYSREDLMNYISDCELVLILPGDEEVVVASMVDRSDAGISLGKNHSDILPFIKDKYSTLFFRFTLKEIPPTGIDVFYDMIVNYEYDIEKERE